MLSPQSPVHDVAVNAKHGLTQSLSLTARQGVAEFWSCTLCGRKALSAKLKHLTTSLTLSSISHAADLHQRSMLSNSCLLKTLHDLFCSVVRRNYFFILKQWSLTWGLHTLWGSVKKCWDVRNCFTELW